MDHYAEEGATSDPMLMAFFQTQHLNFQCGGAVITPWELLPGHSAEEWVEVALMLAEVPNIRKRKKAEKKYFDDFRRKHKDYAQLHYPKRSH